MAGASLFALIDDIASLLDDVAILSKVAVQKTAGVLGDDLALNAHQLTGVDPARELPVVWAVARGSIVNKAILVPGALAISALLPQAVTPLLIIGGVYLCYEGCEKLLHRFLHSKQEEAIEHQRLAAATVNPQVDMVAFEKEKIAGAVRTDFILSAEIIVIALGTVAQEPFYRQVLVLLAVAMVMTVGVYGLVAAIVKLDDLGLALCLRKGGGIGRRMQRGLGRAILAAAPYLLKLLTIAGTVAMFVVGGGILTHGVKFLHDPLEHIAEWAHALPDVGWLVSPILSLTLDAACGLVAGAIVLAITLPFKRKPAASHQK